MTLSRVGVSPKMLKVYKRAPACEGLEVVCIQDL